MAGGWERHRRKSRTPKASIPCSIVWGMHRGRETEMLGPGGQDCCLPEIRGGRGPIESWISSMKTGFPRRGGIRSGLDRQLLLRSSLQAGPNARGGSCFWSLFDFFFCLSLSLVQSRWPAGRSLIVSILPEDWSKETQGRGRDKRHRFAEGDDSLSTPKACDFANEKQITAAQNWRDCLRGGLPDERRAMAKRDTGLADRDHSRALRYVAGSGPNTSVVAARARLPCRRQFSKPV